MMKRLGRSSSSFLNKHQLMIDFYCSVADFCDDAFNTSVCFERLDDMLFERTKSFMSSLGYESVICKYGLIHRLTV